MNRERTRDGITGGLLLIGIGVLLLTGWWWPGIMVVLGIAIGAGLVFRGRYLAGLVMAAIFFAIPLPDPDRHPLEHLRPHDSDRSRRGGARQGVRLCAKSERLSEGRKRDCMLISCTAALTRSPPHRASIHRCAALSVRITACCCTKTAVGPILRPSWDASSQAAPCPRARRKTCEMNEASHRLPKRTSSRLSWLSSSHEL